MVDPADNPTDNRERIYTWADVLRAQTLLLLGFIAIIWLLEIVDTVFLRQALNGFGVRPRRLDGLWGILLMPLLHGGLGHLLANTVPFFVLSWLVMLRRFADFVFVTVVTLFITGFGLWLFGAPNAVYIGASGLVFGYFGFLVLRGLFERSPQAILIAVLVVLLYGGLIWGVLPQQPGVSWGAHLLGFLSGVLAARLLSLRRGNVQGLS